MILDLFLLRVFHTPSYCSFTSNLTACFTKKILIPSNVNFTVFNMCCAVGTPTRSCIKNASINYQLNIYYVRIDYRLLNRHWYIQYIHYDYNKFNYR